MKQSSAPPVGLPIFSLADNSPTTRAAPPPAPEAASPPSGFGPGAGGGVDVLSSAAPSSPRLVGPSASPARESAVSPNSRASRGSKNSRASKTSRESKASSGKEVFFSSSSAAASKPPAPHVVYGAGALARLPSELARLGLSSPLIVSSPSRISLARRIQSTLLPALDSRILDSAVVSVPARVVDRALDRIQGRDAVISVGGASAVGLAAAIAQRKDIPHVCVPTTYSGSEMMPLLCDASPARHNTDGGSTVALSGAGKKQQRRGGKRKNSSGGSSSCTTTLRDPRVAPTVIIYDEELTGSTSARFSAPTGSAARARGDVFASAASKGDETAEWSYIHLPGV